ncbi:TetR/AcrR family transcriptional regulator [Bacillus sp. HMF5848]|uniref:TetR/AcrR family transcriptional regulator n=1 Tax=Bacillus sp. HMF5848 TaxID=2495421 RepID=UPI000F7AB298|nr:TetR/AcrR family transcriptional regulator [Bacillus sp. HMF5848]RSK27186.1 TetR/AcrR family transcriptional regulator [Bacillus sp. HMF5848]
MSPRKPANQELTKDMIIAEARKQFVERDFNKVSMRSIAKQLNCSHGSLYYHFKNKADLFYAIVEEDFHALNTRLDETIQSDGAPSNKLQNVFIQFIKFGLDHQSQYELMFMKKNEEVDSLSQEAANLSFQRFAEAVQTLSDRKLLIKDIYSAFVALHGFVSHHKGYANSFDEAKEAAHSYVDFILKAIR